MKIFITIPINIITGEIMIGLVNIKTKSGKFYEVAEALMDVPEVKEVYGAYGEVDLIAKVETLDEYLSEVVIKKIQSVEGIVETNTTILIPIEKM